jgi:hypothetical protein
MLHAAQPIALESGGANSRKVLVVRLLPNDAQKCEHAKRCEEENYPAAA